MDSTPQRSFRRRVIVERSAQLYLSLVVLLYLLVATILTLAVILLPSILKLSSGTLPPQEQLAASREFLFLDRRVVPAMVLMMFAVAAHFVFVSQRIFGPLVRLKRVLRRWREEGAWPPPLHVRRRDFHAELFEEFSAATGGVGRELAQAREHLRAAAAQARGLAAQGGAAASSAAGVEEACRHALEPLERWRL